MTTMNPFDLAALIIIVLSTFWGGMRGIISQITTLAAWGVSLVFSARYYVVFAPMIPVSDAWKIPCSAFVAFVVSYIAISIAGRFLKKAVSLAGFKEFDRQIGALLGLLKGVLLCLAITFFFVLATDKTRDIVDTSKSGAFFIGVIANVQDVFPDSELKTKFAEIAAELKKDDENKPIDDEVRALKQYLTTKVFTPTASQVVKEADEEEEEGTNAGKKTSLFQSFVDGARNLNRKVEEQINKTTPNVAFDSSGSSTENYAAPVRNAYDDSNSSYSSTSATSGNSTAASSNDESSFKQFWSSLGSSSGLPGVISSGSTRQTNVQTQGAPITSSSASNGSYSQGAVVESSDDSTPEVSYGAYRSHSNDSGSRLRSYRYSIVGPSNY